MCEVGLLHFAASRSLSLHFLSLVSTLERPRRVAESGVAATAELDKSRAAEQSNTFNALGRLGPHVHKEVLGFSPLKMQARQPDSPTALANPSRLTRSSINFYLISPSPSSCPIRPSIDRSIDRWGVRGAGRDGSASGASSSLSD